VLAELSRRELVPVIWLPDPLVRAERERARWRLHLVRHRSSLKQRVHAVLLTHGKPCPVSDLFGVAVNCSPGSICRSRGKARSRPACA
jgi:transposase